MTEKRRKIKDNNKKRNWVRYIMGRTDNKWTVGRGMTAREM